MPRHAYKLHVSQFRRAKDTRGERERTAVMLKDAALKHLHVDAINRLPNEIRSLYWEKK